MRAVEGTIRSIEEALPPGTEKFDEGTFAILKRDLCVEVLHKQTLATAGTAVNRGLRQVAGIIAAANHLVIKNEDIRKTAVQVRQLTA